MKETVNFMLVSLHRFLYPARDAIFIVGLLYLIATAFYYKGQNSRSTILQKRIVRNAMLNAGLAAIITSYGAILEIQEQEFIDNLFIFVPLCTLLVPGLLVLFLWIGFYFVSKSKEDNNAS